MKVAPHKVSGRVVKTTMSCPPSPAAPASALNVTSAPSLRPIQLVCNVRMRSGQSMWS